MIRESVETTLLLIRHARTVWNSEQRYAGHTEVALAPEADAQIRQLTRQLVQEPISAIYSSPLRRCLQTITPAAEILGLSIGIDTRLQERDLGAWEGRPAAELSQEYPGFKFPEAAYLGKFVIPDAESLETVALRTKRVLEDIAERHPGETVLIATHAGIIWAAENILLPHDDTIRPWPDNSTQTRLVWKEGTIRLA